MGKRDKRKKADPQKKALQKAAKEAKQDKKAAKKLAKEQRKDQGLSGGGGATGSSDVAAAAGNDDDIDAILASYKKRNLELTTPNVEVLGAGGGPDDTSKFPAPPRGNFTLTAVPGGELVMFGGEYFDGVENVVFDELLRWNPDAIAKTDDDSDADERSKLDVGGVTDDILLMDINEQEAQTAQQNAAKPNPGVWKRILSPPPLPPARCSHTAVYYNNAIYIFGGELATSDKYHHYKDLWRFDIKTNLWSEVSPRGGHAPPSRSGHRCIIWRHYMIMFGGFYEALRETRWYNDLWVFDFSTNGWTEMTYSKLATLPDARSAFNFCLAPSHDTAYLYGGYSKLRNPGSKSEARVYSDSWCLNLKPILTGRTPTWDRISRRGEYPSMRSGTSCVAYKSKMLVFGGVSDEEQEHHTLKSIFFDDLFAFDMDRRRWFKMGLKKSSKGGRRRKRKDNGEGEDQGNYETAKIDEAEGIDDDMDIGEAINGEAESSGWDLDKLRTNMFAFIDGDGNVVYEKIEDSENEEDSAGEGNSKKTKNDIKSGNNIDENLLNADKDDSMSIITEIITEGEGKKKSIASAPQEQKHEIEANEAANVIPHGAVGASEVMAINPSSGKAEAVARETPLPRIHASVVVRGNQLLVYGGLLEVGDREVTLDDCWSIDLTRREKWVCLWPGSMHRQVWRGINEDSDSYISTGVDDSDDDENDGRDWIMSEAIDEEEEGNEDEEEEGKEKPKKKKERTKDKIIRLREEYSLDDLERTPEMGETMADFYSRTAKYWEEKAAEIVESEGRAGGPSEDLSTKELKREGFTLARERYEHLRPVLDSLLHLEEHMKEKEMKRRVKKESDKKERKKKKDRKGS